VTLPIDLFTSEFLPSLGFTGVFVFDLGGGTEQTQTATDTEIDTHNRAPQSKHSNDKLAM